MQEAWWRCHANCDDYEALCACLSQSTTTHHLVLLALMLNSLQHNTCVHDMRTCVSDIYTLNDATAADESISQTKSCYHHQRLNRLRYLVFSFVVALRTGSTCTEKKWSSSLSLSLSVVSYPMPLNVYFVHPYEEHEQRWCSLTDAAVE